MPLRLALLALVGASGAGSIGEGPPAPDRPLFPRMTGYVVVEHEERDSGSARFCKTPEQPRVTVSGRYWHWHFQRQSQNGPGRSPASEADVRSHYREALKRAKARFVCETGPDVDGLVVVDGRESWLHVRAFTPGETYQVEIVERKAD